MAKKFLDHEGLKYLWKKIENNINENTSSIYEFVSIICNTNQSSEILPSIHVTYDEETKEYEYNGSALTIKIPADKEYTISFGEVSGWKAPSQVAYKSEGGNSRTIIGTYNATILNIQFDGVSGKQATVKYDNNEYKVYDNESIQIPYGKEVTVIAPDVTGFVTPKSYIFTTTQPSKDVILSYIPSTLKINILSNQLDDIIIDAQKAQVTWEGGSEQIGNGETISIPINVPITITYPDVTGYTTPTPQTFTNTSGAVEKTGTYSTTILTINMAGNQDGLSYNNARATVSCNLPFFALFINNINNNSNLPTPFPLSIPLLFAIFFQNPIYLGFLINL